MPTSITILADCREKKPLPFPSTLRMLTFNGLPESRRETVVTLAVKQSRMEAADYALDDAPGACYSLRGTVIVERKAALDEIATNCLDSSRRAHFVRCLTRMAAAFPRPFLIFEGGLPALYRASRQNPSPWLAIDALQRLCLSHNVPIINIPAGTDANRRLLADYCARLLVNGALPCESLPSP